MFKLVGASRLAPGLIQKRSISYTLPAIKTLDNLRSSEKEFKGLFSNNTINELWYKRGTYLVESLNQLLEDNNVTERPSDLNQLIKMTFNKPDLYGVHSYASMLYNLQFYLESLKPTVDEASNRRVKQYGPEELLKTPLIAETYNNEPTDPELRDWINYSFGSVAEFRTLLLNSAKGIKGDGSVWLVAQASYSDLTVHKDENQYNTLAVMNTYNAGFVNDSIRSGQVTKLQQQKEAKGEFLRKQEADAAKDSTTDAKVTPDSTSTAKNALELGSVEEAEAAALFMDRRIIPLVAIDASPRNYILDYGVFGKQPYLDNVWDCIDWSIVSERAPKRTKPAVDFF